LGAFLVYNLKISFCFVLFYILYKTVLSRNTFYEINRRVLFFAYLIILLTPFIDLRTRQSTEFYLFISGYEQFFVQPSPVQIKWTDIIVSVYLAGVLFFGFRYLYYTGKIVWLLLTGEKIQNSEDQRVVVTDSHIAPFSWMKHIVLSRTDYLENGQEIIAHESAHVEHGHFIDLLLAELFAVVQWYNPSIWLIKNELKDIHEYEADHAVLDSGFNPKQYQLLLIKKAVGSQRFNSMTNSLNHSKLKKRITMMLKEKSSPWAKMKYLTVLPLIAFALTVFARPEISEKLDKISEVKVSEISSIIESKIENFAVPSAKMVQQNPAPIVRRDSLTVEEKEKLNQMMAEVRKQTEEVRKQFESEEWKEQMRAVQEQFNSEEWKEKMRVVQEQFNSEEWKEKMKIEWSAESQEKLRQQMEEVRKQFESEEWKEQMKAVQEQFNSEEWKEQMRVVQEHFNSEEWKEKMKAMQEQFNSEEWKEQMKAIQK